MLLEAENMPTKTTGGATSVGWNIWSNGYIEQTVTFPSAGAYTFDVVAAGKIAAGVWPLMELRIDGISQGSKSVSSGTYAPYRFTATSVTAGSHRVAVAFTNYLWAAPEERALLVDKVTIAMGATTLSLPDVVVTNLTYANGIYTATVKNQGSVATPAGVQIGSGFFVDGVYKTYGFVSGTLAAGASGTFNSAGSYIIPSGTHTIMVYADDVNRFPESNETNNQLSMTITAP